MKKYLILPIFLYFIQLCNAQQMIPGDVPAPNASNLGMYGNIPVSYYTGRANISIPIFEMEATGISLPIYLQHDASGVLVNSLPSWTGHNWTLMAGGAITRCIEGVADEYEPIHQSSVYSFTNYFHSIGQLCKDINNDTELASNLEKIRYDYAPDIFYFNFMGITGKFFMGNDGQWKVLSDHNLDVVFDVNNTQNYIVPFIEKMPGNTTNIKQPKVIKGFVLRDDKGNIYEFGGNNTSIEYSTNFFSQTEYEGVECWNAITWYLTKVKDRYGNILFTLDYERGKFIAQLYNFATSSYVYENAKGLGLNYGQEYYSSNFLFPYGGTLNAPVYLKHISSENSIVVNFISSDSPISTNELYPNINLFIPYSETDYSSYYPFYYLQCDRTDVKPHQYNSTNSNKNVNPLASTRLRQLDEIQLCNADSQYVSRKIKLNYSYNSRMHLTEYSFCNSYNEVAYTYKLEYNNYNQLPSNYLSTAADHWGYYTGKEYKVGSSNIYETRAPIPDRTTYGLLRKIVYPTGGYSLLSYEQNDFFRCIHPYKNVMYDTISTTGGVRIFKIEEYSKKGQLLGQRTFDYTNPLTGKSSGELFAAPCYSWENWMANLQYNKAVAKQSLFRSSSIMPLSNSFGPHIGYSYVTETNADNSKTRYHYTNMSEMKDERFIKDFCQSQPSPFDRFTDRGYRRGHLLDVSLFDEEENLKKKVEYSYPTDSLENNYVLTSNLAYVNNGSSATFGYYTGGVYKLLYPKYDVIDNKTVTYYEDNDSIVDVWECDKSNKVIDIAYEYPHKADVRLLDSESTTRMGTTIKKEYGYGCSDGTDTGKILCSNLFYFEPIWNKTYNNDTQIGGEQMNYQLLSGVPIPLSRYVYHGSNKRIVEKYLSYYPNFKLKTYQKIGEPIVMLDWSGNQLWKKHVGISTSGKILPATHSYYWSHNDLEGVGDIIYPNGKATYNYYDSFGRLMEIEDEQFRPVIRFYYNYAK